MAWGTDRAAVSRSLGLRLLLAICIATVCLRAAPSRTPNVSPLLEAFRIYVAEVEQMVDPFGGGLQALAGASLVDMAKVDFIVGSSRPISPRYVNDYDRKFVLSAVRGQSDEELEAHLPALVNYVRLSTAVVIYYRRIRAQELIYGEQRGIETLRSIGRRVTEFRAHHLALVRARKFHPAQVLTTQNLGEFGDAALIAEIETAYTDGRSQFLNQRNAVVWLLLLVELGISFAFAVIFLQKQRPLVRIRL